MVTKCSAYIVDNIVLQYIELHGQIKRSIGVLKSRGSNHAKQLRELVIANGQIKIGDHFRILAQLMAGIPQVIPELADTRDGRKGNAQ